MNDHVSIGMSAFERARVSSCMPDWAEGWLLERPHEAQQG